MELPKGTNVAYLNGNGRSDPERQDFERMLLEIQPQLRGYARSLTRDADSADDLVQDSLIKALRGWRSFAAGTNLRAWLFTITRNLFLSERRRDRFRAPWDPELAERTLTTDGEILEAEASLDFHRLLLCLACISQDQSDALIAVGYLGLSYEDTAERLGCMVGTVKSRVARGRVELASWFESTAKIPEVDISWLKTASRGIPKTHPVYPIAKAYEEVYAAIKENPHSGQLNGKNEGERAWDDLVASGALDFEADDLDNMMRNGSADS